MINMESVLIVLFGGVIVFLLFIVHLLQRRVQQLLGEMNQVSGKMKITSDEIEELTKNVEEIKNMKI